VGCLQALLCDARGDPHGALDAVSLAVELGRPGGFVRMYADFGGHMLPLLERLLVGGRRDDHIVRLIEACCTLHRTGDGTALSSARGRGGVPETPSGSARAATTLTNRELDVLVLLDQRLSNKEIARRLVISPATVKRHSLSIYRKLGVGGRREAAVVARELGILPLP
jgi:LuxR family maltose regulon positive regulatory protein